MKEIDEFTGLLYEAHKRAVIAAGLDPQRVLRDVERGQGNTITVFEVTPGPASGLPLPQKEHTIPIPSEHPWYGTQQ